MYIFDFHHRLKQLNSDLYINTENYSYISNDWRVTGIYLRLGGGAKRNITLAALHYLPNKSSQYLMDIYSGAKDLFVGSVPLEWVPEYTIFDPERGEILARGWRSILLDLARQNVINLDKAKKLFSCASLGNSDYDRMSLDEKLVLARKEYYATRY